LRLFRDGPVQPGRPEQALPVNALPGASAGGMIPPPRPQSARQLQGCIQTRLGGLSGAPPRAITCHGLDPPHPDRCRPLFDNPQLPRRLKDR